MCDHLTDPKIMIIGMILGNKHGSSVRYHMLRDKHPRTSQHPLTVQMNCVGNLGLGMAGDSLAGLTSESAVAGLTHLWWLAVMHRMQQGRQLQQAPAN